MLRPTLEPAADRGSRRVVPAARGTAPQAVTPGAPDTPAAPDTPTTPDTSTTPDTPPAPVSRRARVVVDHRDDPAARRVFSRAILGGGPGLR